MYNIGIPPIVLLNIESEGGFEVGFVGFEVEFSFPFKSIISLKIDCVGDSKFSVTLFSSQ